MLVLANAAHRYQPTHDRRSPSKFNMPVSLIWSKWAATNYTAYISGNWNWSSRVHVSITLRLCIIHSTLTSYALALHHTVFDRLTAKMTRTIFYSIIFNFLKRSREKVSTIRAEEKEEKTRKVLNFDLIGADAVD